MQTCSRVAMWSGPRNISTAMMRAWGNRHDTAVCDESLYAHYLLHTGVDHPGAAEVIAHHEPDWRKAVAGLVGASQPEPASSQALQWGGLGGSVKMELPL